MKWHEKSAVLAATNTTQTTPIAVQKNVISLYSVLRKLQEGSGENV